MKLTQEIINEWMMHNGEDFYIDGPLSMEMQDKMIKKFADALFEKGPNLVEGTREDVKTFWDLDWSDDSWEDEGRVKLAQIFCDVSDEMGFSEEIMADVLSGYKEDLDDDPTDRTINYIKEDSPTIYEILKG